MIRLAALLLALIAAPAFAADFPVVCAGIDDTAAVQAQITAATPSGGRVVLPTGTCVVKAALNLTDMVTVEGAGFYGIDPFPGPAAQGTTIVSSAPVTFNVVSVRPVYLKSFQINYPVAVANSVGVSIDAPAGKGNYWSVVRDVGVVGADTCLLVKNGLGFNISDNILEGCNVSADLASVNFPGSGDSNFHDNTLSGGTTANVIIRSGGGLRVVNNKLNQNGTTGIGIYVTPNATTTEAISPLIIANNSIEGAAYGILFQRNAGTMRVGNAVITGNEIVGSAQTIVTQLSGVAPWILGLVITDNFLVTANGGYCVMLYGISGSIVDGNQCVTTSGAAYGYYIAPSPYNDHMTPGTNGKGVGVS